MSPTEPTVPHACRPAISCADIAGLVLVVEAQAARTTRAFFESSPEVQASPLGQELDTFPAAIFLCQMLREACPEDVFTAAVAARKERDAAITRIAAEAQRARRAA